MTRHRRATGLVAIALELGGAALLFASALVGGILIAAGLALVLGVLARTGKSRNPTGAISRYGVVVVTFGCGIAAAATGQGEWFGVAIGLAACGLVADRW